MDREIESRRFLITAHKNGRVMAERIFHEGEARLKSREPFAEITVDSSALTNDAMDQLDELGCESQYEMMDLKTSLPIDVIRRARDRTFLAWSLRGT